MKIDWPVAAKLLGVALAATLGLSLLPELLKAPEPPPLDPKVGLLPAPEQAEAVEPEQPARTAQERKPAGPAGRDAPRSKQPPALRPRPEPPPEQRPKDPKPEKPSRAPAVQPPASPASPQPLPAPAPVPLPAPAPPVASTAAEQEFGP